MGQSVNFVPVPAGLCCKNGDYGATRQPLLMSDSVSVLSFRRYLGEPCLNNSSFISSLSRPYHAVSVAGNASVMNKGGVCYVA